MLKDFGTYDIEMGFDGVSIYDENDMIKEEYKHYFTKKILNHPLADWFNNSKSLD